MKSSILTLNFSYFSKTFLFTGTDGIGHFLTFPSQSLLKMHFKLTWNNSSEMHVHDSRPAVVKRSCQLTSWTLNRKMGFCARIRKDLLQSFGLVTDYRAGFTQQFQVTNSNQMPTLESFFLQLGFPLFIYAVWRDVNDWAHK